MESLMEAIEANVQRPTSITQLSNQRRPFTLWSTTKIGLKITRLPRAEKRTSDLKVGR
jgi:hypothetical protein